MRKITFILGLICAILAGMLFAIGAWLFEKNDIQTPTVSGASLELGLPELQNKSGKEKEMVTSESAVVWNKDEEAIQYEKDGFTKRPIASLTKLMTAMIVIDHNPNWDKTMTIEDNEWRVGGKLTLAPGETVTMKDLLHASLMGSANNATLALARGTDLTAKEFLIEMNRKAIELKLEQTKFADVTGLDPNNISTAYEAARLAETAYNDYPLIKEITSKKKYKFSIRETDREHTIINTNNLIPDYDYPLSGSKTGYLPEAGFCLAVQGKDKKSKYIVVVLKAPSEWDSMKDVQTLLEKKLDE